MINWGPLPLGPHSSMLFEYYYLWKGSKIIEGKKKEPLYEPLSQKYWGEGRIRPPPARIGLRIGQPKKKFCFGIFMTLGQRSSDYISMQIPKFWVVTLILHLKYEIGSPGIWA